MWKAHRLGLAAARWRSSSASPGPPLVGLDQRGDHGDDRGAVVHHHARDAVLPPGVHVRLSEGYPKPAPTGTLRRLARRRRLLRLLVGRGVHGAPPHRADQHALGRVHGRHRRQPDRRAARPACRPSGSRSATSCSPPTLAGFSRDQRGDPHRLARPVGGRLAADVLRRRRRRDRRHRPRRRIRARSSAPSSAPSSSACCATACRSRGAAPTRST